MSVLHIFQCTSGYILIILASKMDYNVKARYELGNMRLILIMPINFLLKILSAFYICFKLLLIMEANTMNPDQTAPKGAV